MIVRAAAADALVHVPAGEGELAAGARRPLPARWASVRRPPLLSVVVCADCSPARNGTPNGARGPLARRWGTARTGRR